MRKSSTVQVERNIWRKNNQRKIDIQKILKRKKTSIRKKRNITTRLVISLASISFLFSGIHVTH